MKVNRLFQVHKHDRGADVSPLAREGERQLQESDTDCVECNWCGNWQHWQCASLSLVELAALADIWNFQAKGPNFMFFCSICKLILALTFLQS